jgi:N-carbamoyl-L-amino-acid hydrolase
MDSIASYVNGERLWKRLMTLAQFGGTPKGGVNRLALSPEECAARRQLVAWAEEIGLQASTDDAANLFLRLEGREADLPPLLIGSHIDSQPTGGKFDGAYGVVAALEAAEAIAASRQAPRRPIEVVAWMNEEGSRFAPGMMGSAVFSGRRTMEEIEAVTDANGVGVREALRGILDDQPDLTRRTLGFPVAGFLEAHIEQGPLLEKLGLPIGIVTGIQGKRTFRVEIVGEESHAGTTPRADRRDALVSAVDIVRALEQEMWDEDDAVRFTIGRFVVTPNAPSVVPGRVTFSIDLRHGDGGTVRRLGDSIFGICERARGRCDVEVTELLHDEPVDFPNRIRDAFGASASQLGIPSREMPSPAGHDARYLSYACPTGMIFIPCKGGISHNEAESIEPLDAERGARVLAQTAFELADAL